MKGWNRKIANFIILSWLFLHSDLSLSAALFLTPLSHLFLSLSPPIHPAGVPSHLPQTFSDVFIKNKKCDARNVDKPLKIKTNILSSFFGVSVPVNKPLTGTLTPQWDLQMNLMLLLIFPHSSTVACSIYFQSLNESPSHQLCQIPDVVFISAKDWCSHMSILMLAGCCRRVNIWMMTAQNNGLTFGYNEILSGAHADERLERTTWEELEPPRTKSKSHPYEICLSKSLRLCSEMT